MRRENLVVMEYPLRIGLSARPNGAVWPKVAVNDGYLSYIPTAATPVLDPLAASAWRFPGSRVGRSVADDVLNQLASRNPGQDFPVEKVSQFSESDPMDRRSHL